MAVGTIAISIAAPCQALPDDNGTPPSVFALRVATDEGESYGTAVLIRRDVHRTGATLYLLTSSRLFRSRDSERPRPAKAVRLELDPAQSLDIKPDDVVFTGSGVVDVAVLHVTTADVEFLRPAPVVYAPPSVGAVFLVSSPDGDGAVQTIPQHVRFASTLLVIGDRALSGLTGCIGAPAISPDGVFGIVRECEPNRPPVISLLRIAQSFLERYVPRATTSALPTPQFSLVERPITSPLVFAGCSTTKIGEVDVPLQLAPHEFVTDATATLVNPREVRLTHITVLKLEDRTIRLQFTLGSFPAPPAPPTDCPQGQALITLHLRLAVTPSP